MKKLCTTSVIVMTLIVPALADNEQPNIAVGTNPAACNESVLETTSGTSNLEANWNANTLYLSWSVDGQPYATNDSNAASCTYDSGITIPTNPTKTGYTFAGWTVKAAVVAKQCWEIENETECLDHEGCIYTDWMQCRLHLEEGTCSDINNETDCNKYAPDTPIICVWWDGSCHTQNMLDS